MCTAITYQTKGFYFGRTLDYEHDFGQMVTVTPRKYPFCFDGENVLDHHYAIIGMARVEDGYPLYFDAMNEKGLAMAGLNFVGNAVYHDAECGKDNIPHYAFISWVLCQCTSVSEAKSMLKKLNLTNETFRNLPPAQLHWIIADRNEAITVESVQDGIRIYPNPVGVLTNNPPFDEQMFQLNNFMHLSPDEPHNHFSSKIDLHAYSRGMGAIGLPGDLSSQSRFVRAAFTKLNSVSGDAEHESISQFFHILGTVTQTRGCCHLGEGLHEITIYTSCCNADKGIYYYSTYGNHQITSVDMHRENLEDNDLIRYPLATVEQIRAEN